MYSKKLTPFCVGYLTRWRTVIKANKIPVLPVSRTKGMRDFVMDIAKYTNDVEHYADYHDHVMDDSERLLGGYLKPSGSYWQDGYVISSENVDYYAAMMDSFDKYLCSDGVIRYVRDEDGKVKCRAILQRRHDEFWEGINQAFEDRGMFYNDERGCWINPETGEEGCY